MIRTRGLTRRYGEHTAIQDLDLDVERGEIVGFLGPNGAGKSTTMRILCGAVGATSGTAEIGGLDVLHDPQGVKRLVGYLPERPPLHPEMTVREYLRFAARLKGAAAPRDAAERAAGLVGLADVAHRLIGHLSKGYQQRVGIAQALVHEPRVLILDEPASGLDPAQRREIWDLVRNLSAGDTTVLLSTHVLPEVEALCDRVVILHRGRVVARERLDRLAGAGRTVHLRVARPSPPLEASLAAIPGVEQVEALSEGLFRLRGDRDLREAAASAAVSAGLLELGATGSLEALFLSVTGGAPAEEA